jgi:hypothetical protein
MRLSIILMTFFSLISFSQAGNIELNHKVLDGKWHKSGDLVISHKDVQSGSFEIKIKYDLDPKGIMGRLIKSFLKGEYIFNFPEEMLYERGYENLKQTGPIDLVHEDKVAILKYLKKVDIDGYQGAHKVEIRSKSTMSSKYPNGKWHIHLYYHPSVESVGVFRSKIFYHGKAGNYNVESIEK